MRGIGWALVGLVVTTSTAVGPVAAQDGGAQPSAVDLPAELDRVLRDYEAAWQAASAEDLAALFTEDGFVMRPGRPPTQGRAAILEAYRGSGGPLALRAFHYAVEGEVGYILGGFSFAPGQPDVGKFVLALRRAEGGRWMIVSDMDNGN